MFFTKPVQSAGNELVETLRQPDLSEETQIRIIGTHIRLLEDGMKFFLSEDIDSVPKAAQKLVLQQIIRVSASRKFEVIGFSLSQRRQAADKYIPLVDSASEATHIFLWDNKTGTDSLIVDSFMTESQMRELIRRGRIGSFKEGIELLASLPANFLSDELPKIVEDIIPHTDAAVRAASLISTIREKYPEYPLTNIWNHTLPLIETGVDGVYFLKDTVAIKNLSLEQRKEFIRHVAPLITSIDEAKRIGNQILWSTREMLAPTVFLFGKKYHNYLSEEETRYLIDDIVRLFDWPEELEALHLERKELKYARKAMKAKGQVVSTGNSLAECLKSWLKKK